MDIEFYKSKCLEYYDFLDKTFDNRKSKDDYDFVRNILLEINNYSEECKSKRWYKILIYKFNKILEYENGNPISFSITRNELNIIKQTLEDLIFNKSFITHDLNFIELNNLYDYLDNHNISITDLKDIDTVDNNIFEYLTKLTNIDDSNYYKNLEYDKALTDSYQYRFNNYSDNIYSLVDNKELLDQELVVDNLDLEDDLVTDQELVLDLVDGRSSGTKSSSSIRTDLAGDRLVEVSSTNNIKTYRLLPPPKRGGGTVVNDCFSQKQMKIDDFDEKINEIEGNIIKSSDLYKGEKYIIFNGYNSKNRFISAVAKFMWHLFNSHSLKGQSYVPINKTWLQNNGFDLLKRCKLLQAETGEVIAHGLYILKYFGLIDILKYNKDKKISRRYMLTNLGRAVINILSLTSQRFRSNNIEDYNLETLYKDNIDFSYYPYKVGIIPNVNLLTDSINNINKATISITDLLNGYKELSRYIRMTRDEYIEELRLLIDTNRIFELDTDMKIFNNMTYDLNKLKNALNSKIIRSNNNTKLTFDQTYVLAATGRLCGSIAINNLTRYTKHILFERNKTQIYNYDIKSSQVSALLLYLDKTVNLLTNDQLDILNSTIKYLYDYIKNPEAKYEYAKRLNIPVDDWKRLFYSVIFGASTTNQFQTPMSILNCHKYKANLEEYKIICDTLFKPVEIWLNVIPKFINNFQLTDAEYNDYLEYVKLSIKNKDTKIFNNFISYDKNNLIYNGITFIPKDNLRIRNSKFISAYFLQGIESLFVFNLVNQYPGSVISYEYDGLLSNIKIEDKKIQIAKLISGFENAELIIKGII